MDPIHPGFAKTLPEWGLLQVVLGREKQPLLLPYSIELFQEHCVEFSLDAWRK